MQHLADQRKTVARLAVKAGFCPQLSRYLVQALHKVAVQAVGDIKAQAVHAQLALPHAHGVEQVIDDGGVAQVELHQVLVALPALVPKAVAKVGIAVKADVEPVFIGRLPAFLLHVSKGPKAAPHVVEYRVQNHAHPADVQRVDRLFKVLVGTQSAVDGQHVAGVVSVRVRGEDRVEQNGAHAQLA